MKAQRQKPNEKYFNILAVNIANLFKVKTIITLCIILTFCILTLKQTEISRDFMLIISNVITYFYAKDSGKSNKNEERDV